MQKTTSPRSSATALVRFFSAFAGLLAFGCWVAPAEAQIISNLNGNDASATTLVGNLDRSKAVGFTMSTGAYELDNVILRLDVGNITATIGAAIYGSSSGLPSGPALVSFLIPSFSATGIQNYTFAPSSTFILQPATTYFLVVYGTSPGSSTNYIDWMASSPAVVPTGVATYAGAFADNSGAVTLPPLNASAIANSFAVNGTVVAVPEANATFLLIPIVLAAFYQRTRARKLG